MERTRKSEGLFSDTELKRTKQGMQSSVDTFSANIKNYMIPRLREAGYDGRLVRSDVVLEHLQKKENFSTINPRYLLHDKGEGWWLEIWPKENRNHKMIVKPTVIESTKSRHLKNHPRFNLCLNFLKRLSMYHKNIWVRTIWDKFYDLDLHFLIMTKTGMFWMGKYSDIPDGRTVAGDKGLKGKIGGLKQQECGWELTYRNDPKRPDRIAIRPDFQVGRFLSIRRELRNTLLTQIYYWTKNNVYESK
jgi:hypothetical protein